MKDKPSQQTGKGQGGDITPIINKMQAGEEGAYTHRGTSPSTLMARFAYETSRCLTHTAVE